MTVAFTALALTDPSLRTAHEQTHAAVRDVCALALVHLDAGGAASPRPAGGAASTPEPAHVDVELTHAVVDGLALHLLAQAVGTDASWAVTALDAHLALLALRP